MRSILIGCMAVGAAVLSSAPPAHAELTIRAPGIAIDAGPHPYWRENREAEWRERREFREAEFRRHEWLRDHCVRDWTGHEYCRR